MMKNLKISKRFKAAVLAGSMVVLCGIINESEKSDIEKYYDYHPSGIMAYMKGIERKDNSEFSIKDYKNYLIENNLVPFEVSDSFIEKKKFDDGSLAVVNVYDDKNDCYNKKNITPEELKNYSGIVEKSREYSKKVYTISFEGDLFLKEETNDYLNFDKNKYYFVDLDDSFDLIGAESFYYFNGKEKKRIKK